MSSLVTIPAEASVPLVVDLDGTLVASDLLAESVFALLRKPLAELFKLPAYLANGRAALKAQLARVVQPEVSTLPYRRELLAFLEAEKRSGRTLILATGTNEALARKVAEHVGLFDRTLASDRLTNLAGETKAERLAALFGDKGFDYLGNSWRDLPVWRRARKALLVQPSAWLRHRVAKSTTIERVFAGQEGSAKSYLEELRWHHWIKNVLVFVPLFAEHRLYDIALLDRAILAFVAFSLCASSIYLFNDLLDLPADRSHPLKKNRPLAAGQLSIAHALVLAAVLLGATVTIGTFLPTGFLGAIGIYFALNLAYCLRLKDIAYLDALVLGAGYSMRIVAGAAAVQMRVSPWLLIISLIFFFGLALLKRYADLISLHLHYGHRVRLRGYGIQKNGAIFEVGTVSGFLAVLVLALYGYLLEQEGLHFVSVVAICTILLFWTMHLWRMAKLGKITGDPVAFVYRDRISQIVAALMLTVLLISA